MMAEELEECNLEQKKQKESELLQGQTGADKFTWNTA